MLLTRAALEAMPQHTAELADRLRRRMVDHPDVERSSSPRSGGPGRAAQPGPSPPCVRWSGRAFNHAVLQANQVLNPDSLLALRVNGVDLSFDHGYPARIIVPALPGVHNTKWVRSIEFGQR